MRRMGIALGALMAVAAAGADGPPSGDDLLTAMDRNLTFASRTSRMKMTVTGRRTRVYEMVTFARGEEDAAIEYVAPVREKGTRMLKLGGELWLYLPGVDRVQKISGHMLRQGMMGSDFSYEDLMTSRETRNRYRATVTGEDTVDGRACWKLELVARDDTVAYPRRVSWVDRAWVLPLKQELYALSGMLLKTWTMSEIQEFEGGRRFPTLMTIKDNVKKDSVTRLEFSQMRFSVPLERETFTLRWLERSATSRP